MTKKQGKSIYVLNILGLIFPGSKGVTKLGQIISIFPCSPSICLAADKEKVYINI